MCARLQRDMHAPPPSASLFLLKHFIVEPNTPPSAATGPAPKYAKKVSQITPYTT